MLFFCQQWKTCGNLRTKCTYLFLLDEPVIYHQNDEMDIVRKICDLLPITGDEEVAAFHLL